MSNAIYPTIRGLAWPVMKTSLESTIIQTGPNGTTTRNPQWQNPMWNWTLTYEYVKGSQYDVLSTYTPYTDYQILQGFYMARQGQYDDFVFSDPSDNTVGPPTWTPNTWFPPGQTIIDSNGNAETTTQQGFTGNVMPTWPALPSTPTADGGQKWFNSGAISGTLGQALTLVNDGAGTYYSPLQRNFGGQFLEDITDLNTTVNPLRVWANGVLQVGSGTNYTVVGPGLAIPGYSFMGLVLQWTAMPTAPITAAFNFYFRVRFDMDSLDFEEFLYQIWTIGGSSGKNGAGYLKLTSSRAPGV